MIPRGLPAFGAQPPPHDPHALAREILSERRFRVHVANPAHKTWWEVATSWLQDRWNELGRTFAHHVHIGAKASVAAGDIILAVTAGVVLIVAIRLISAYVRETVIPAHAVREIAPHLAAEALFAQSMHAGELGEYAAAIALVFRAALAALDIRGVVHDQPSRTVNECRREVRERAPAFLAPFDALARIFTAALYADAPVTQAQWAAAREAYTRLVSDRSGVA